MAQVGNRAGRWLRNAVAGFLFVFAAAAAPAWQVELVSRVHSSQISETGAHAWDFIDSSLSRTSMSADGRYVVFVSTATNLAPGQKARSSGFPGFNVFLRDLVTGSTTLVSRSTSSPETAGNQDSVEAVLSADGRYVVFASYATDLAPGQDPERDPSTQDLLLFDRATGTVTLVVPPSPGPLRRNFSDLKVSPNGRWIAFVSTAFDLVPGQFQVGGPNVFLHDRVEKTTRLVSHSEGSTTTTRNAGSWSPLLSDDGRYVAFLNGERSFGGPSQAFLYDRRSQALTQIASADAIGMSADGRFVAYLEFNTTFLYDRDTRQTTLLGAGSFTTPAVSGDGRYVAFGSSDDNLVPGQQGDTVGGLFLYDRIARTFSLASRQADSATRSGSHTDSPAISRDGRYVAFVSTDPSMVSGQTDPDTIEGPTSDVFLFDRTSGKTTLLSGAEGSPSITGNGHSWAPVVSANGARVAFWSAASDLVEGLTDRNEGNDAFVFETSSGDTTAASVRAPDLPSLSPSRASAARALSADGRFVAFVSESPYLVAGQIDTNDATDVFLYDRTARTTTLVSRTFASAKTAGNGRSSVPILSPDGRYVAFASEATNLVPGNEETGPALFLYDRASATTRRLSVLGVLLEDYSLRAEQFSADGRYLVFVSHETDLVPGQQEPEPFYADVFLYDLAAGTTTLVSRSIAGATVTADNESSSPSISADGRFVAFLSEAKDLIPRHVSQIDADNNVFLYDRTTGAMTLVSRAASSATTGIGAHNYSMSADGRIIAFSSFSDGFLYPDVTSYLFLYDRVLGTSTQIVPRARPIQLSANGRFTLFSSPGVIPELDPGTSPQLYLYDAVAKSFTLVTRKSAPPGLASAGQVRTATISADGRSIAFVSNATDLVAGQVADPLSNPDGLYLFDRIAGTTSLVSGSGTPPRKVLGVSSDPHLSANGRHLAFTNTADLVPEDLNGEPDAFLFTQPGGPVSVPACTLFDTRRRQDRPALRSGVRKIVKAHGSCTVPARAKSVVVKVTVVNPTGKGNLRFYPGDSTTASAGILRFERGKTRSGSFTIPLATDGTGTFAILPQVAGNGTVHVVVEVSGYLE